MIRRLRLLGHHELLYANDAHPRPLAFLAICAEFFGGMGLLVGLLAAWRLSALPRICWSQSSPFIFTTDSSPTGSAGKMAKASSIPAGDCVGAGGDDQGCRCAVGGPRAEQVSDHTTGQGESGGEPNRGRDQADEAV